MTILLQGLYRMSFLSGSTWVYCGLGHGTATVAAGDVWLGTSVLVKGINAALTIDANTTFNTLFGFSEVNSTATITELIMADQSTSAGNILLRSVASTNTWTGVVKSQDRMILVNIQLVFST